MIIEYSVWKEEIERFSIHEFGSIEATREYSSVIQRKLDGHMHKFCMGYVKGDKSRFKEIIKLNKEYMRRYTKELRG